MGKALIIAEKPSVASDISKALGGFKKHEDYYESDRYVISSAVGHLLELCVPDRFESDWLVGINGTRAMTAFNSKTGGFHLTTVGRVQTPTLAILVEREERIKNFVPKDYWEIHGTFGAKAGEYPGRWFDEQFAKKEGESDLKPERIWEAQVAESIRAKCLGKPGVVTEESKPTTQLSPLLYDLTSLQREANSRFGFSAKNTLGLAQALYERHKVLTYPRTDSRALPEDYIDTVKKTFGVLAQI